MKEVIEMQELPAATCAQCGLRLEDVGGVRIVAAEGLKLRAVRGMEGRRRWFCQRCAHVVCDVCGSIRIPLGADILHDDGTTGHAAILPLGNRYCSNPACVHGPKPN